MAFTVPTNQTVSFTVYKCAVEEACRLPHDFIQKHAARIEQAFDMGEPIWMIVDELKMRRSVEPTWKPTKTPRALATRAVKVVGVRQ